MPQAAPLDGVVVVEIGHSVAAPYAGLILADLGARVLKVENPGAGDYARGWGPPFWGHSASVFHSMNRGKESLSVDFSNTSDAAALRALILEQADVVIQNLRPGTLAKYHLDAASLTAEKPDLIYCDIGAFGAAGPLADRPGYDPLMQAFSGIMSITGEVDRPPVRVGVSLIDMGSGLWTVIGLLAALLRRAKAGGGARIATSLFETGLAWMTVHLAGYAASGDVRRPHGSGLAEIVPYQAFPTRDGHLMIAAGNDKLFRHLCEALGLAGLPDDPAYATNAARVANRDRLIPMIEALTRARSAEELGRILDATGVPNAPIQSVDQVMAHPQTRALGIVEADGEDALPLVGIPLSFDGVRPRDRRPAPTLGPSRAITCRRDRRTENA